MHSPQNSKPQPPNSPSSKQIWKIRFCVIVALTSGFFATLITQLQSQSSILVTAPQPTATPTPPPALPQADNTPTSPPQAIMGEVIRQPISIPSSLRPSPLPSLSVNTTETDTETDTDTETPILHNSQDTPSRSISQPQTPPTPTEKLEDTVKFAINSEAFLEDKKISEIPTDESLTAENYPFLAEAEPLIIENKSNENETIELSLQEVVILALENNRTIKNQYLERIIQQQNLIVAEDKFNPDFTPDIALEWENLQQGEITSITNGLNLSARVIMQLPTGGEINLGWEGIGEQRDIDDLDEDQLRQNLQLSVRQPLLRNAGIEVNRASIEIARVDEKINILGLKSTLIDQITDAILAYRQLIQAQERLQIELSSLEIARQQVENTQILIDAGRRARVDIIPVKSRVANQEVSLLEAENNLKQRQLNLLEILDINPDFIIVASDIRAVEPQIIASEELTAAALENRPNYLIAKLNIQQAEYALKVAENQRKWNIDLEASINHNPAPNIIDDRTEFRAGLNLTKDLGDRTIERDFKQRQVELLQAENNLDEQLQQLQIDIENSIRDVQEAFRRVELAQRATELAEQQLLNQQEKVKLGVENTSIVDLVGFQEELGQARNDELNAKIDYLNSITNLQQIVGITLDVWDIIIEEGVTESGVSESASQEWGVGGQ
ncbi:MAG: TolC family protein [Microcoleaceae cyanobacterium]